MDFGTVLTRLRKSRGYSRQKFVDAFNARYPNDPISIHTYIKYETTGVNPMYETLSHIADFYHVSIDYLFGRAPAIYDPIDNLPADEREKAILSAYLALDKGVRREIMATLEAAFLSMNNSYPEDKPIIEETTEQIRTIYVTFYSDPVSAGTGTDLLPNDEPEKQIEVIASPESEKASFAVRVSGDSMTPTFMDGDIILARECSDVDIGEIGVFEMDGEGYVKEYGGDTLISHNPAYPPIPVTAPLRCAGRVLGKAILPEK